jgi:hypothetical protein
MRNGFLLAAFVVAAVSTAAAQSVRVDGIDVVDKGIYEITAGKKTADPNTPTKEITAVTGEKLVTATDTVAGKIGTEFGLRYVVKGDPAGAEAPLDFVITYPPPGLKDPAEAAPVTESRYSRGKKIGDTIYLGYGFENDWEIVPGTWTFAIFHDGKKLAEESFTVTAP